MAWTVGRGESADSGNDGSEVPVVSAHAGVEIGELCFELLQFRDEFIRASGQQLPHADKSPDDEYTHPYRLHTPEYIGGQVPVPMPSMGSMSYAEVAANAAHVLVGVAGALLDRQIERLAADFEREGGFTERLYRIRSRRRMD